MNPHLVLTRVYISRDFISYRGDRSYLANRPAQQTAQGSRLANCKHRLAQYFKRENIKINQFLFG